MIYIRYFVSQAYKEFNNGLSLDYRVLLKSHRDHLVIKGQFFLSNELKIGGYVRPVSKLQAITQVDSNIVLKI